MCYLKTRKTPAFGGISLALRGSGGKRRKKKLGRKRPKSPAPTAPLSCKNFRRVMRIPNMYLVLKLDNGKEVSIANEQTDRITQPSSTVL